MNIHNCAIKLLNENLFKGRCLTSFSIYSASDGRIDFETSEKSIGNELFKKGRISGREVSIRLKIWTWARTVSRHVVYIVIYFAKMKEAKYIDTRTYKYDNRWAKDRVEKNLIFNNFLLMLSINFWFLFWLSRSLLLILGMYQICLNDI